MKILEIAGYFRLPDDFNGTFADALREFAAYHESTLKTPENRTCRKSPTTEDIDMVAMWSDFLKMNQNDSRRADFYAAMTDLDESSGTHSKISKGLFSD